MSKNSKDSFATDWVVNKADEDLFAVQECENVRERCDCGVIGPAHGLA